MDKKLNTQFLGTNIGRHSFLYDYFDLVCNFLGKTWTEDREFYVYTREILKNIYDHNGGYGYANIEIVSENFIVLEIGNSSCPDSVEKEHTSDHKVNCNVGLSMIKEVDFPFIKIEADKNIDYKYKIIYNRNLLPPNRLKLLEKGLMS